MASPKIVRKGPLPGDTNPVEFRLNGEVEWRSSVDPDGHWYIGTEYVAGLFNTTLAALRAELEGGEGNES